MGASFLQFSDVLTGYRLALVLMLVQKIALFNLLGEQGATGAQICAHLGWKATYGQRFLRCLERLEIIEERDNRYHASAIGQKFFNADSPSSQAQTLLFEQQLLQSWQQLEATLEKGQRVYATRDKSEEELNQALSVYLGSMDEAASVRAEEVFAALGPCPPGGTILDLGGGSGAYLASFLRQNPSWSALFCDLPQVVDAALEKRLAPFASRITPCRCNLLAQDDPHWMAITEKSCNLVLLSNLIHCQGPEETRGLLRRAAQKTADSGWLLIHDFFSDCGWRDALYDLHMMLNTYNGCIYTVEECADMATRSGFCCSTVHPLASGSTLLRFARSDCALPVSAP